MNYYNEHDPKAAAWLRELINAGLIPNGDVDERSITEVQPDELRQYTQCHFFAGIGGWSLALQIAGVSDTARLWTGSCPCQPFSSAGKGLAQADERHLWPVFFNLIKECKPDTVFGEQVASAIGKGWLDGVSSDLESEGYACGATVLGAHSVSAPHIRQRLYWVADSSSKGCERSQWSRETRTEGTPSGHSSECSKHSWSNPVRLANAEHQQHQGSVSRRCQKLSPQRERKAGESTGHGKTCGMANTKSIGCGQGELHTRRSIEGSDEKQRRFSIRGGANGFWSDSQLIPCRDGKTRRIPTEPAFQPLANGISARVVRLRGYGNAIVPQVAAEFVKAFLESQTTCSAVTAK